VYSSALFDHPEQVNTLEIEKVMFNQFNKKFFKFWSSGYYTKRDNRFILTFWRNVLSVCSGRLNMFQVDAEASTSEQDISHQKTDCCTNWYHHFINSYAQI
jgi:hypothetical protein